MTARTKTTATTARATAKAKTRTTARITADPCASLRDDKQKNDNDEDFARKDFSTPTHRNGAMDGAPHLPGKGGEGGGEGRYEDAKGSRPEQWRMKVSTVPAERMFLFVAAVFGCR
jgi:hypothetical protein